MIKIRFSSRATIVSPLDVSNLMKLSSPSFNASTTCLPFPISEVTYAATDSLSSISKFESIGKPDESQMITPRIPSLSSKRRIIALTSALFMIVYHTLRIIF